MLSLNKTIVMVTIATTLISATVCQPVDAPTKQWERARKLPYEQRESFAGEKVYYDYLKYFLNKRDINEMKTVSDASYNLSINRDTGSITLEKSFIEAGLVIPYGTLATKRLLAMSNVRSGKTLRVPQHYGTIQEAIAHARPGDRIEVDATQEPYRGPIVIDVSNLELKSVNGMATVEVQSKDEDVIKVVSNSVVIEGFKVRAGEAGIVLSGSNASILKANLVEENKRGISLESSTGSTLEGNITKNNTYGYGIWLKDSNNNHIVKNTTEHNWWGIYLESSTGSTLEENTVRKNTFGINLKDSSNNHMAKNTIEGNKYGINLDSSIGNILEENIINNNKNSGIDLDWSDDNQVVRNTTEGSENGIYLDDSTGNILEGNTVRNNDWNGISLWDSGNNHIVKNTTEGNMRDGVFLGNSSGNTLKENIIGNNGEAGIWLQDSSDNQIVKNATEGSKWGVLLVDSTGNTLKENIAKDNIIGIYLWNSSSNHIVRNTAEDNVDGIVLDYSTGNIVEGNTIKGNEEAGIWFQDSSNNRIVKNTAEGSKWVIGLDSSTGNILEENTIKNSEEAGIWLQDSSDGNQIVKNTAEGSKWGIHLDDSTDNTLEENIARNNGESGICLKGSGNNQLVKNTTEHNELWGIHLDDSTGNTLEENVARNNNDAGIWLEDSGNNQLAKNTAEENNWGIHLDSSIGNTLEENVARNNDTGIWLEDSSDENQIVGNSAEDNKRGIFLNDSTSNILAENIVKGNGESGIWLKDSSNTNTLKANSIEGSDYGIVLEESNENKVGTADDGNIIKNNAIGIDIRGGGGNIFKANTVEANKTGVILGNYGLNIFCFPPLYDIVSGYEVQCFPTSKNNNVFQDNREDDIKILGVETKELLVQFKEDVSSTEAEDVIQDLELEIIRHLRYLNIYHLKIPAEANEAEELKKIDAIIKELEAQTDKVAFAEINAHLKLFSNEDQPNDSRFSEQWNLHNEGQYHPVREGEMKRGKAGADIGITRAWEAGYTDSSDVLVVVIDTGTTLAHQDLVDNLEFMLSRDFVHEDEEPLDRHGHGTFISGVIGASGNNEKDIAGVSWKASIIPIQVGDVFVIGGIRGDSRSDMASILEAIDYVIRLKESGYNLRVVNFSLGYPETSNSLQVAVNKLGEAGILLVTAAGNNGWDNDALGQAIYPCNYENENIICVGASTDEDELAEFSNFGAESVDLVAPGKDIVSLVPSKEVVREGAIEILLLAERPEARLDEYTGVGSGTSFAVPHVSGVAALLFAACPKKSAVEIKEIILDNVERIDGLGGKVKSGGRLKWPDELPEGCQASTER